MYSEINGRPETSGDFGSLKPIVCAVITGRAAFMTREDNWREKKEPFPGAHSHCANRGLEYVLFDDAQMLPCYVIHLDLGRDAARCLAAQRLGWERRTTSAEARLRTLYPRDPCKLEGSEAPGDKQRIKQALMMRARKFFPYGFG